MPNARISFITVISSVCRFGVALLLGAAFGSLIQSQLNLSAIAELAGPVSWQDKRNTMQFDLRHFLPTLAALMCVPMLMAVLVARWLRHWQPLLPRSLYFLLAAVGFYFTLLLVNQFAPMPTLLAANRTVHGTLGLLVACGLAAWCYAWLTELVRSYK